MFPKFYDPKSVGEIFVERGNLVAQEAENWKKNFQIPPSSSDGEKIAAFGIDCQISFCLPQGSLYVPGAVDDTRRTIEWLYKNIRKITTLFFSLDTHYLYQIFHPAWWRDEGGNPPAPFTVITAEEIRAGRWTPTKYPKESLLYCEELESTGKYKLTIWPYHTLMGGIGHSLVPALFEAALFHSLVRESEIVWLPKGEHPLTENYSVLSPEVTTIGGKKVGEFNKKLFQTLLSYDRVYIFGQASSHCVLFTLRDIQNRLEKSHPQMLKKIWILKDAMSPVPPPELEPLPDELNFPKLAEEALEEFRKAGMNVVDTEYPV